MGLLTEKFVRYPCMTLYNEIYCFHFKYYSAGLVEYLLLDAVVKPKY